MGRGETPKKWGRNTYPTKRITGSLIQTTITFKRLKRERRGGTKPKRDHPPNLKRQGQGGRSMEGKQEPKGKGELNMYT